MKQVDTDFKVIKLRIAILVIGSSRFDSWLELRFILHNIDGEIETIVRCRTFPTDFIRLSTQIVTNTTF